MIIGDKINRRGKEKNWNEMNWNERKSFPFLSFPLRCVPFRSLPFWTNSGQIRQDINVLSSRRRSKWQKGTKTMRVHRFKGFRLFKGTLASFDGTLRKKVFSVSDTIEGERCRPDRKDHHLILRNPNKKDAKYQKDILIHENVTTKNGNMRKRKEIFEWSLTTE